MASFALDAADEEFLLKSRAYTHECLGCGRQTSITSGTVMQRTKLPLTLWFWAAHLISIHPLAASPAMFKRLLNIPYNTSRLLKNKISESLYQQRLRGVVEVDHRTFAPTPIDALLAASAQTITIAIAMASPEIRLASIPDGTKRSLGAFVRANVEPGATVMVDRELQLRGYGRELHRTEEPRPTTIAFECT